MREINKKNNRNFQSSNYILNDRITSSSIRVIEGIQSGIYSKAEALIEAEKLGLDLILISPNANPPVCKILDFKKFLYEEKKKIKDKEKNQTKIIIKEIRFTPNIGEHDYEVKKRKTIEFLEKGNKVKVSVFFKGRGIMFKEQGELILVKLANEIEVCGIPESIPKMESKNRMGFVIKPKK